MTISSHLYEAYLKCPTKCFLRALGEMGTGNAYADWVRTQNASYRTEESQRLRQRATRDECIIGPLAAANLKSVKWNLAIDLTVRTHHLESTIHAVETQLIAVGAGDSCRLLQDLFKFDEVDTEEDLVLQPLLLLEPRLWIWTSRVRIPSLTPTYKETLDFKITVTHHG
jgi:hypothetical protein